MRFGFGLCVPADTRGLVLGPELLLNGGFDTDTGWSKPADWTISGGVASIAPVAGTRNLSQVLATLIEGRQYLVSFTVSSYASGAITPALLASTLSSGTARSANGTFTEILIAGASPFSFRLQAAISTALSVDNVSLREVLS